MPEILAAPTRWALFLAEGESDRDFSRYDGYLDSLPVIYLAGDQRKATATLQLRPTRQDVGQTEFEARPEFGDWFAQGDFSHGSGQRFFHRASRDDAKYLHAEGFDISEPGVIRHLNAMAEADNANITDPGELAEFNDLPFVIHGSGVYVGDGAFPGTWTLEDTDAGESSATPYSLASNGAFLFLAYGAGGVHFRTTAGTWAHYQPDASTDLDVGDARVVRWLKDRLMVVGGAGLSIYEVVGDSTPTAIETLPAGWEFTDIFEAGPFILACAVNATAGLSRVHAYGLNSGLTAIEKKSSTPMPKGILVYTGIGAQGRLFLAGGQMTTDDGKNAVFAEAVANDTGELQLLLIAREDDDTSSDFSVRAMEFTADSVVLGWGRDDSNTYGRFTGLARYNLARNAFSLYLSTTTANDRLINDVMSFRNRILMSVASEGLYYEDVGTPVTTAFLITSIADWNNPSKKLWDLFEITHNALPVGTQVALQYSKKNPSQDEWQDVLTSETPGAVGADERLEDVLSRILTLKITSTSSSSGAPEPIAYWVRSVPAPDRSEWRLTRTVRVLDRDRKDRRAEPVKQDPRTVRAQLQDLAHTFVTVYEPGITWIAYVEDVAEVEPGVSMVSETEGTSEKEAYFIELHMIARRAA